VDSTLRSVERAARGSPDDPAALRALAVAAQRSGDGRSAWRARAALARVTNAPEEWRALDERRVPEAPARVTEVTTSGDLLGLSPDGLLVRSAGLRTLRRAPVGAEVWSPRWSVAWAPAEPWIPCGPDLVRWDGDRLHLLAEGQPISTATLDAAAIGEAPPGVERRACAIGDRAVLWHWTRHGHGARTVVDIGLRFGEVIAQQPLQGEAWTFERFGGPPAGRHLVISTRDGARVEPLEGPASSGWSVGPEPFTFVRADPEGLVMGAPRGRGLVERDLVTGALRWTVDDLRPFRGLEITADVVLARYESTLVAWCRRGAFLREVPSGGDLLAHWVVGADLLTLERVRTARGRPRGSRLVARDLLGGEERWSIDGKSFGATPEAVRLVVADGALALDESGRALVVEAAERPARVT
jgi:hypothetical protein